MVAVEYHRREHRKNDTVEVFIHLLRVLYRQLVILTYNKSILLKVRFQLVDVIRILITTKLLHFPEIVPWAPVSRNADEMTVR